MIDGRSRSRLMKVLHRSIAVLLVCWLSSAACSQVAGLPERLQTIMGRPEFAHATFGVEFYSLDSGKILYQLNSDKLMVPGSTTKLLTEGTMLELLGGDYRFHT